MLGEDVVEQRQQRDLLTDTPEQIQEKITEHAFSGGQMTKKLQEEKGADLDVMSRSNGYVSSWRRRRARKDSRELRERQGRVLEHALVKNRLIKLLKELSRSTNEAGSRHG